MLKTVDDLSVTQCKKLGISIVEAETTLLLEAGRRSGALSFEDWLCFLLCQQNGWTCVTNDRALIRECKQCKIHYRRGLRLMIDLIKTGHLRNLGRQEPEKLRVISTRLTRIILMKECLRDLKKLWIRYDFQFR